MIEHFLRGRRVRVAGVLDQVAVGCRDDLAAIYRDYWDLVYKRCYATLLDDEAAQDATQDVFLQALKSFDDLRHDIVRGLLDLARTISYERKRRPTREIPLADPPRNGHSGDDPAEIAERHRVLDDVWAGLSAVERRYLADKFAGFSFEEIARRNRRALGTVSSNLARAREHARKMREPMLPAVLGLAGWRRLGGLGRRARTLAQSSSAELAAQPVGSLTMSLTVAGLLAGLVPGAAAAPALALSPQARGASALSPDLGGATGTVAFSTSPAGTTALHAAGAAPASRTSVLPALLPTGSAATETPEDTDIVAATASPNYSQDHTIVALGHGNACNCQTLLMSSDGGATWSATAGPPAGNQILLSPTFPSDPAIFVGFNTATSAVSNFWAPRFGAAFQPLGKLPAGELTLPAGFGHDDNRVIASTPNGVWSEQLGSTLVNPLLIEPQTTAPALATPFQAMGGGVLALTTSQAVSPGQTVSLGSVSGGETLWSCPPTQACVRAATVPLGLGAKLATSPTFEVDHTVAAYDQHKLLISVDSGSRFVEIPLPWSGALVGDLALTPRTTGSTLVWTTVLRGNRWAVMTFDPLTAGWAEADASNPAITGAGGRLLVLGPQSVLFLLAHGGLLCTVNGGVTWEARCPAA